jgi:hypothetical protein
MSKHRLLNYLIATVWFVNGLFCKVLDLVPRHRQIVARILGEDHAAIITKAIGLSEIAMAVWIISGFMARLNVFVQVIVIATMNVLEFIMVPDLLLWGRFNALFAFIFMILVLYNAFYLNNKVNQQV